MVYGEPLTSRDRGPLNALDQHVQLLRWWKGPYAQKFGEGWMQSVIDCNPVGGIEVPDLTPVRFRDYMVRRLDASDTVFIDPPVVHKLWDWAQDNDRTEVMLPQDFFTNNQYIWLEDPLRIFDARGRLCTVRVICAFVENDGAIIMFMGDHHHPDDEMSKEMGDAIAWEPRTPLFHFQPIRWGVKIASAHAELAARNYAEYMKVRRGRAAEIEKLYGDPAVTPDNTLLAMEYNEAMLRFLIALGDYMNDKIPYRRITVRANLRRHLRSQARFPAEVRVIDMRVMESNPFHHEGPSSEVHWTHRWRSREHMRAVKDRTTGEIKYYTPVRGSIKGPKHLPLIEKDNVYNVRR